ncbi:MAG: 4-alpha-glucanotransferase [Planctomycetota bacterium]|nr:MAG: 4-alpha-glucanotransferase [Planctomycetota bacterium]
MRVLMLGWEFPPHISGGLGTACYGLSQGLKHHGVDVTFVVPRAHGDEDPEVARIVGCNSAVFPEIIRRARESQTQGYEVEAAAALAGKSSEPLRAALSDVFGSEALEREGVEDLAKTLRVLAVDSLLSPYLDENSYQAHLREKLESRGLSLEDLGIDMEEGLQSVIELRQSLVNIPGLDQLAVDQIFGSGEALEFSGAYGPNLFLEVARYAVSVGEIARREEFDVIHAHDWMTYAAGAVAREVSGKPLLCHLHASEYDRTGDSPNPRVRELEQLGFLAADRIVCVSRFTASKLRKHYEVDPSKIRVVHNAVRQREEALPEKPKERDQDAPIVLFLGRITFQKGPDYFLEAARRVIDIEPKVKFVMAGSGDMWPEMVERAARIGLARHIHFTGFLRGPEVDRMYRMADLYVMPSVSEPFGISPLEAMAQDVPVIVSKQSGVSEVLTNALKVDFWDVDDMADKILGVLRYRSLREVLRREGRAEVKELRWEVPAKLVKDIYEEMVS